MVQGKSAGSRCLHFVSYVFKGFTGLARAAHVTVTIYTDVNGDMRFSGVKVLVIGLVSCSVPPQQVGALLIFVPHVLLCFRL